MAAGDLGALWAVARGLAPSLEGEPARALAPCCVVPLASRRDRVHRRAVELDANGRPSAFTLAQGSAEVKGLTLNTDTALEQVRELQRHLGELAERDEQLRARGRAARIRRLAAVTVVLWLATLIVVLAHV